jgi:hypothetical protein
MATPGVGSVISVHSHPYSDTIPNPSDSDPETPALIPPTLVSSETLQPPWNPSVPFQVGLQSLFPDAFPDHPLPI